ncbi:NAD(P)-binding protein [Mycena sanguinolenta]|uniref:NAD(P)-binding protein n=1 Tax=Mycena sanguinolenta TaxID=230812 RepID=A0A8H6X4N7_9AGAR|nr:NAD(P)-binding protein [Mycena sanguinolenta]
MIVLLTGVPEDPRRLAELLLAANQLVVSASRSGKIPTPLNGVRFNWLKSMYTIPFDSYSITAIYLIAPPIADMLSTNEGAHWRQRGVGRFVLSPFLPVPDNGLKILAVCGPHKTKNEIMAATGNGLLGFVSTKVIAEVAFKALVDEVIESDNSIVVGLQLRSGNATQVADMLTDILGRKIKHVEIAEAVKKGVPEDCAQMIG